VRCSRAFRELRLARKLAVPQLASEQEVAAELAALAARNAHAGSHDWFLGAGIYSHYAPTAIDALISRAEFTTAYTPYQPEISQGTLQTIFEWQTMMCGLTGLEVSNASLYDGASASAEAVLMAMRLTRRRKVVVANGLHPHYGEVLDSYVRALDVAIVAAPRAADGRTAPLDLFETRPPASSCSSPVFGDRCRTSRRSAQRRAGAVRCWSWW
jgi:glycine dehydrogenase subunit 1